MLFEWMRKTDIDAKTVCCAGLEIIRWLEGFTQENYLLEDKMFKMLLNKSMHDLFGEVSSNVLGRIDLIHYDPKYLSGIIRLTSK